MRNSSQKLLYGKYLLGFLLALMIESVILLTMIFANLGMNHAANAEPSQMKIKTNYLFFIFHFPTVLLTYGADKIMPGPTFIFFTPFTQIIFWTLLFEYIFYRKARKSN